jgi:hypothetical protein
MKLDDWLRDPLFWAVWYLERIGTEEEDSSEFLEPFFGVPKEEVYSYYGREISPGGEHPPIHIELPFLEGFALGIDFVGEPDYEDRYVLRDPELPEPVLLGYHSGHFALPAFRWQEVVCFPAALRAAGMNDSDAEAGLLLFFPGVYLSKEEDPAVVQEAVAHSWRRFGVAQESGIGEMVQQCVENQSISVNWRRHRELGWINDGHYSLRNPGSVMAPAQDPWPFPAIQRFMVVAGATE